MGTRMTLIFTEYGFGFSIVDMIGNWVLVFSLWFTSTVYSPSSNEQMFPIVDMTGRWWGDGNTDDTDFCGLWFWPPFAIFYRLKYIVHLRRCLLLST